LFGIHVRFVNRSSSIHYSDWRCIPLEVSFYLHSLSSIVCATSIVHWLVHIFFIVLPQLRYPRSLHLQSHTTTFNMSTISMKWLIWPHNMKAEDQNHWKREEGMADSQLTSAHRGLPFHPCRSTILVLNTPNSDFGPNSPQRHLEVECMSN